MKISVGTVVCIRDTGGSGCKVGTDCGQKSRCTVADRWGPWQADLEPDDHLSWVSQAKDKYVGVRQIRSRETVGRNHGCRRYTI